MVARGRRTASAAGLLWLQHMTRSPDSRPMRLAKYLAHAGVASRRAAETLIAGGRVTVDGEIVTDPARDVGERSRVTRRRRALAGPEPRVVYALQQAASASSPPRATRTAARPCRAGAGARACACTRSAGWTPTRAG